MKNRKLSKILGIGLSLMLVLSLGLVFTAAPVAADDDAWSTYDFPLQGADSDYFIDVTIADGPGPIARDIDGYFWAYVEVGAQLEIAKSLDTEGRTWELTAYHDDVVAIDASEGEPVVDIFCSPLDADVVYIAVDDVDFANTDLGEEGVYKTVDGGDTWTEVGNWNLTSVVALTCAAISNVAVGFDDDGDPRVFAGAVDAGVADVHYLYDVTFGVDWNDTALGLTVDGGAATLVFGLNVSPDFADDAFQSVLATDGAKTWIAYHVGSAPGGWSDIEILNDASVALVSVGGSDPMFPEDFNGDDFADGDSEIFVGIDGPLHAAGNIDGGVVRICGVPPAECHEILDDIDADIISLDLVGNLGNTQLLAGESGTDAGEGCNVWFSYDDGENWDSAAAEGIQPAGNPAGASGATYVIMEDDFDEDTGIGWAATAATALADESCFSMSIDGAVSFQGISLINTDSVALNGFAIQTSSPETVWWLSDDTATTADLFRWDDTNWERVYEENQYGIAAFNAVTALGDTTLLYVAGVAGNTQIYFSSDGGQIFANTDEEPCDFVGDGIQTLIMLDEETWWVGDDATAGGGDLWTTDDAGDRCWDGPFDIDAGANAITSLDVSGDNALAGNIVSEAYYSDDEGETWAQIDTATAIPGVNALLATYVAFDSDDDSIMYAASDNVIARFTDLSDLDLDWEAWDYQGDQVALFGNTLVTQVTFSGIACLDGVVYASDADATNTDLDGVAGTDDAQGALWRCTNPLEDLNDADASDWDWVSDGLALTGVDNFDGLQATPATSNSVWANDITTATLWVYGDLMVGPTIGLICDPAGTDQLVLEWNAFAGNTTDWELKIYEDEAMTPAYLFYDSNTGDDAALARINGVAPPVGDATVPATCTQYWWKVRAMTPVHSKWSETILTCNTGAGLLGIQEYTFSPTPGDIDVPLNPSFGWVNIDVDSYDFEFSTVADFSTTLETASVVDPVYNLPMTLEYDTNYFWRVRPVCGGTAGLWAYATFTTLTAEAAAGPPPAAGPTITIPPVQQIAPKWIYAIIGIGAGLAGLVIALIVRTRRTS